RVGERESAVRGASDGTGRVRESLTPGAGGPLRPRPRRGEEGKGRPVRLLGQLAHVQRATPARPRSQPGRLPRASPRRLPRRPGATPPRIARPVPVRLPEPSLEPDARPLAARATPARATLHGP